MKISEIRLQNLTTIIDEDFGGIRAALARAAKMSPNNISRYYSENIRDRRDISDDAATAFEQAAGRPAGWLSLPHDTNPVIARANELMSILPPDKQEEMIQWLEFQVARVSPNGESRLAVNDRGAE